VAQKFTKIKNKKCRKHCRSYAILIFRLKSAPEEKSLQKIVENFCQHFVHIVGATANFHIFLVFSKFRTGASGDKKCQKK
jgi:hypothetical protein